MIGAVHGITKIDATAKTGADRHFLTIGQMTGGRFAHLMVTQCSRSTCRSGSYSRGSNGGRGHGVLLVRHHFLLIRHGGRNCGGCGGFSTICSAANGPAGLHAFAESRTDGTATAIF